MIGEDRGAPGWVSDAPGGQKGQDRVGQVGEQDGRLDGLEAEVRRLGQALNALQDEVGRFLKRYAASCPACKGEFDLLVNHYSIGLFDNLVYVKCPHCNKAMPIVDRKDGGVGLVVG